MPRQERLAGAWLDHASVRRVADDLSWWIALAGHATAAFTLQRYTHHYDASASRTADTMGDILADEL